MSKTMDANTPQLKAVDRFYEAYRTCDLMNAEPLFAKNYRYKTLPKHPDLPDMTKEEHCARLGPMFARCKKFEHLFHDVIEAPGKVVLQWTALLTPLDGPTVEYDSVAIITLVEEDGEIKVLEFKDITNPETRAKFYKVLGEEGQIA